MMTTQAISTPRPQWIRMAVYADALVTDLTGVALVVGSGALATQFGVASGVLVELGIAFFLYAIGVFMVANRWFTARNVLILAVVDVAWVVGTEALLLSNVLPMTSEGRVLIGISHIVVGVFAVIGFVGARQMQRG